MPRYYFHVSDSDHSIIDDEGTELPDLQAAHKEAVCASSEMLRDGGAATHRIMAAHFFSGANRGAPMRKNAGFAIAAAVLGLAITVWVKSSVDATGADGIRPKVALITYSIASSSYLPIRGIEPGW
jgi:hypothetical protein